MSIALDRPTPASLDWASFLDGLDWQQGEHVTLLGPTGVGKTTLALELLERREYVMILAPKKRDPALEQLRHRGYRIVRTLPIPADAKRVILWPKIGRPEDLGRQRETFAEALRHVYRVGGWCVNIDELRYVCEYLRLAPLVELLWQQGRTMHASILGGTQRPSRIPLTAYDQATHLFFWRESDDVNIRRLGGLGGADSRTVRRVVPRLDGHRFLYVNTRTGSLATSEVEL